MQKEKHPVLDLPMEDNDADAKTIREYLKALLTRVVKEEEGFDGKRPFGNSGWIIELYTPLVVAGLVKGKIDPDYEGIEEYNEAECLKVLLEAIKDL